MESSTSLEIYFDNNATTQPLLEVREAMLEVLGSGFGNPSSAHSTGDRAREHLLSAREAVAALLGVESSRIIFTSGGTESNNLVFANVMNNSSSRLRVVTTEVEHSSILKYCEFLEEHGAEIVYLPVDRDGRLSLSEVEAAITPNTALVSIQWVNNETGVIQPVKTISDICQKHGVLFHSDAAQAVGKVNIDLSALPVDFLSLSGHKFHGPQGVGALYTSNRKLLSSIIRGGPQEGGLRAGTENLPGIVGIGKAAELRHERLNQFLDKLGALRDQFEQQVFEKVPGAEINGDRENRVCNTTNILFRGVDGQALVARLDMEGIRCSQSSACTNQRPEPSYVLRAMGLSEEEAYSSVRFSFSGQNSDEEIEYAVTAIEKICKQLLEFTANRRKLKAAGGA